MGRSQETFGKKEREKKRLKKKKDKELKREERKSTDSDGSFDSMIAYVDEFGNITDTPPDDTKKVEIEAENIELGVPKREKEELQTEFFGKVAFFNHSKGYGFINDRDSQEKYFVHVHGCVDDIEENDSVTFELEKGMKGLNAVNVKRV